MKTIDFWRDLLYIGKTFYKSNKLREGLNISPQPLREIRLGGRTSDKKKSKRLDLRIENQEYAQRAWRDRKYYYSLRKRVMTAIDLNLVKFRLSIVQLLCKFWWQNLRRGGEIGRHKGLKIPRSQGHGGSIPPPGIKFALANFIEKLRVESWKSIRFSVKSTTE